MEQNATEKPDTESLPWHVKAMLVLAVLVVAFVLAIDLLGMAAYF